MTLDALLAEVKKLRQVLTSRAAVIHMRIGTHGARCAENTHPFAVNTRLAIAHNGVIDIDADDGLTDSETYVRRVLRPMLTQCPTAYRETWFAATLAATGSKYAWLDRLGQLYTAGHFYGGVDGCMYSNLYHESYPVWAGLKRESEAQTTSRIPRPLRDRLDSAGIDDVWDQLDLADEIQAHYRPDDIALLTADDVRDLCDEYGIQYNDKDYTQAR
jgi:hypothetical protein